MTETTPQIELAPLQVWAIGPGSPKPMRRIRLLAKDPVPNAFGYWIFEELGGGVFVFHTEIGRLGRMPEYNLKHMTEKNMAVLEHD